MNWESLDLSDAEETKLNFSEAHQNSNSIHDQNEQKIQIQLKKYQDKRGEQHKLYASKMTKFGDLLISDNREEIANTLSTEDCEIFLFNLSEQPPKYAFKPEGFINAYNGSKVIHREVRETYVDLERTAGFQICDCKVLDEKEQKTMSHYSFEAFSFTDGKVSKYRAIYGCIATYGQAEDHFQPSRSEIMRAKVKELNCAWVAGPDYEKIASLLDDNTDYKIWRMKDKKGFTFKKTNFVSEFRKNLEEEFVIKSVVPFDPTCEAQFFVGSYVYYLEGKGELAGKKYQWMCNCIYTFDKDLKIAKINQQGELYPEDETPIPFEVFLSPEKLKEKVLQFYAFGTNQNVSIFSNDGVHFSFEVKILGPSYSLFTGAIKGFNEYAKLKEVVGSKEMDFETPQPIDIYINLDDSSYDTAIVMSCSKGVVNKKEYINHGKFLNSFTMNKISFENGKLAKLIVFVADIPEPLPSPFDDVSFVEQNIRPKNEFI